MFILTILAWAGTTLVTPADTLGVRGHSSELLRRLSPSEGTTPAPRIRTVPLPAIALDTLGMRHPTARDSLPFRLVRDSALPAGSGEAGALVQPAGIACDAFGRIIVSDAALHRLQRYDARGAWLGEAGTLGSGAGQMRRPGAVAALGTLNLAVLDRENRRVLVYDIQSRLQRTLVALDDRGVADVLGRVDAIDLASDRGDQLYLVDADRDRLLVFDSGGRYVRTVGGFGARPGSFRGLGGMALGRHGDVWVSERVNARVQRLDPGGRALASWSIPVKPTRAALPVAVDDSNRVAVADEANGALWVFSPAGRLLASLAGLSAPRALAFHRDGTLLVAESGGGRVLRLRLEAVPVTNGVLDPDPAAEPDSGSGRKP